MIAARSSRNHSFPPFRSSVLLVGGTVLMPETGRICLIPMCSCQKTTYRAWLKGCLNLLSASLYAIGRIGPPATTQKRPEASASGRFVLLGIADLISSA